ncbi:MAG: sodium:solute symporter, partial [Anaerolineae bacterium]|nr:sodium:solute symporter [Anaerolineae bacterium]
MTFTPLNYGVLAAYLLAMLAIGWRFAGRQHTTEDFFLAGRRLPWLPVAMSFYASVTSANTYLGLPGITYQRNTALIVVSLMSPVVVPVLIWLFYPLYRRWNVTTSYEYAELRFGRPARLAASALFLLARIGWLGMVVYAPSLALSAVTGLPLWTSIILMGLLSTAYTMLGGLSAVVWTDVAQFLIMLGGAVALAVLIPRATPGGVAAIWREARTAGKLTALDLRWNIAEMTGLAVAVSYFFKLLYEYGVDQISVQRLIAVRTRAGLV